MAVERVFHTDAHGYARDLKILYGQPLPLTTFTGGKKAAKGCFQINFYNIHMEKVAKREKASVPKYPKSPIARAPKIVEK